MCKEENVKLKKEFKNKFALVVDQPKVGSGNSNDGNTARKAFQNFTDFSKITRIDEDLIK